MIRHTVTGTLKNKFFEPARFNKTTGEVYSKERHRIQMEISEKKENGDTQFKLMDLSTKNPELFTEHLGKLITVFCDQFIDWSNKKQYFIPIDGIKPQIHKDSQAA